MDKNLTAQLRLLRKGSGLTASALVPLTAITELRSVVSKAAHDGSSVEQAAYSLIADFAWNRKGAKGRAIRNALAVGPDHFEGADITDRRSGLALELQLEREQSHSERTLQRYEDKEFDEMAIWLTSPMASSRPENVLAPYTGQLHHLESVDVTYRFREGRVPAELIQVRDLIADEDDFQYVKVGHIYVNDNRMEATALDTVDNAELVDTVEFGDRYFVSTYCLPEPIPSGTPHQYRTSRVIKSEIEPPPYYYYTPWRETKQLRLHVQFDLRSMPSVIWHFESLPLGAVPGRPSPKVQLTPNRLGLVEWLWEYPFEMLAHGIGWSWI